MPALPSGQTWSDLLLARPPDSPAVHLGAVRWRTADLLAAATDLAGWLAAIDPGPVVPALLRASPTTLALTVAAAGAGTPLAPLNPRATPEEIGAVLAALDARTLVIDPVPATTDRADGTADAVAAWTAALPGIRVHALPSGPPPVGGSQPSGADSDSGPDARAGAGVARPGPADIVLILHTSGTTGRPKPVPVRQDALAARVRLLSELQDIGPGAMVTTASPFHHIAGAGQLLVALGAGATVVPTGQFTVAGWSELAGLGVTHTLMVPTMLRDLLRAGTLGRTRLRVLQYGAAPMTVGLLREVLEQLPDVRVVQLYGQTEGSPLTWLSDREHRRAVVEGDEATLATVGVAVPGVRLWIDDPDPAGGGEVVVTGDHLFGARPGQPLHTGDLGRLDDAGRLTLIGRLGDRIIRGGENVEPVEVETVLDAHPAVVESAVVGIADERLGERVLAVVVFAADQPEPAWAELRAWARDRLSGFKVPDEWQAIDALPRNPSGKILRRLLRSPPSTSGSVR